MSGPAFGGPPMIGGQPLSPVHFSRENGVHADLGFGADKIHIPFRGQTTLDVFGKGHDGSGFKPSWENDRRLADLGGSLEG